MLRRRILHELAEAYSCDSQGFDEEPKRNVVVYTTRCVQLPCVRAVGREWRGGEGRIREEGKMV